MVAVVTRCVVNVATGRYLRGQERLRIEMERFDPTTKWMAWTNEMPPGSEPHWQKPYGFKAWALLAAQEAGHGLVLWLDASVIPIRSLEPLWEKIERDGYWLAINGWTNYEWTADSAYPDLFPEYTLEEAREINKTFPQMVGTAFGLNLKSEIGKGFLRDYLALAKTNAFIGPWANELCPKRFMYGPDCEYTTAICGPPDVIGHRHDQTAASVLAWRYQMKLTQCPLFFSFPPGDETTLLLAVGA
jgi:hypothetical protein